jgi:uncharacterized protein (TIGR00369 family)
VSETAVSGPQVTVEEFRALAFDGVPFVAGLDWRIERFEAGEVDVRLPYQDLLLRPGGTICGPALMALADVTLYGLVLSMIGRIELAVTTDLSFHFLQRPRPVDIVAQGRLLKLGRRLAVGDVLMRSEDDDQRLVCHVVGTYAIPPELG